MLAVILHQPHLTSSQSRRILQPQSRRNSVCVFYNFLHVDLFCFMYYPLFSSLVFFLLFLLHLYYLSYSLDKKYHPTWHCIVGRNFGSYVTHETKHFMFALCYIVYSLPHLYLLLLSHHVLPLLYYNSHYHYYCFSFFIFISFCIATSTWARLLFFSSRVDKLTCS